MVPYFCISLNVMAKQNYSDTRRKLRSSYFTTTISIALVLLILGMIGLLALNASHLSAYVKESLGLTVMLNNNAKEAEIKKIEKVLSTSEMVKSVRFINKEQAAKELESELGEDFVGFLGYNPLLASLEVRLYAQYATPEGMEAVQKTISAFPEVKEIYYQKDIVHLIHENIRRISLVLFAFAMLLLFIATALINNTVRLMVFAKRFTIRTMQLVGATASFIRKPLLIQSVMQGLAGGVIANVVLAGVIYLSTRELSGVVSFQNITMVVALFLMVFVVGVFITWVSTFFAVRKYLNLKTEDLYI